VKSEIGTGGLVMRIAKKLTFGLFLSIALMGMLFYGPVLERGLSEKDCRVARHVVPEAGARAVTEDLPDVIERVVPAVVNISSKRIVETRAQHPFLSDPLFRQFFEDYFRRFDIPPEQIQENLGSGVIISRDGYILTNNHLVGQADEVLVTLPDKRQFDAEIVGTDRRTDVAVLKIETEDLPTIAIGDSDLLRLGEIVVAIGYPFRIGQTVTKGIVSALNRGNLQLVDYENFIQTDAAINPGNSGGALINANGELIGINTAILSRTGGSQGIGFAIPINMANGVKEKILRDGRVIRGWLGVLPQDLDPQMAELFDIDVTEGVVITEIVEGSPAEGGGMERDDIVVEYDGKQVRDSAAFRNMVAATDPGESIEVEIIRDGKRQELTIEIGEQEEPEGAATEEQTEAVSPLFTGVSLEVVEDYHRRRLELPRDMEGLLVTEVDPTSRAAEGGLAGGDVIIEINRRRVASIDDFNDIMDRSRKDKVLLLVYRGGQHFYIVVRS
jgi:serine protease Do